MQKTARWVKTVKTLESLTKNHPYRINQRDELAITDILKHKKGTIDVLDMDEDGVASLPPPPSVLKALPPTQIEPALYTSPAIQSFIKDNKAAQHGIIIWLDRQFHDPFEVRKRFAQPSIDHTAYDKKNLNTPDGYALSALILDMHGFANAIARKWNINCLVEPIYANAELLPHPEQTPMAVLIIPSSEDEKTLLSTVKTGLLKLAKTANHNPPGDKQSGAIR